MTHSNKIKQFFTWVDDPLESNKVLFEGVCVERWYPRRFYITACSWGRGVTRDELRALVIEWSLDKALGSQRTLESYCMRLSGGLNARIK